MTATTEDFIFALRPDSIKVDDIVLTSDHDAKSFGIRKLTKSDFSHAALCTKAGMLFEAVLHGVMRRSVFGTFAPRSEWIMVLRPKMPVPANNYGLRVSDCAEALYGRDYSKRGALASRFPIVGGAEDGAIFCSQVIAQAYADCDVILIPGKEAWQIFPGLLAKSPELMDVTESCVRRIGSATDAHLYKQVVDVAKSELPGEEMEMNRRVFEALRSELGKDLSEHVYSLTDLCLWLGSDLDSDAAKRSDPKILAALEREGLFVWYHNCSAKVREDVASLEILTKQVESSVGRPVTAELKDLHDLFSENVLTGQTSLDAKHNTAREYDELEKRTGLKTFARLSCIYQRQYEDADRIIRARRRFVDAVRQMQR